MKIRVGIFSWNEWFNNDKQNNSMDKKVKETEEPKGKTTKRDAKGHFVSEKVAALETKLQASEDMVAYLQRTGKASSEKVRALEDQTLKDSLFRSRLYNILGHFGKRKFNRVYRELFI